MMTRAPIKLILKKRESADAQASASAPPPPVAPVAPPAAVVNAPADDAPTPEDFEDEAFEKITAQNADAEFARLKKEIEQ